MKRTLHETTVTGKRRPAARRAQGIVGDDDLAHCAGDSQAIACLGPHQGITSMTRSSRIIGVGALVIIIALAFLALVLAHDSPPSQAAIPPRDTPRMKAIVLRQYGPPEALKLEEVTKPTAAHDELLIKVRAASVNPLDWHRMRGTPYVARLLVGIGRPKLARLGVDVSGTVEAIGPDVRLFKVGDEIFGTADGALAAYVTSTEVGLALKPTNVTFQQAASVPVAGLTALQGLRDAGHIRPGWKVLINGASGGVGTFAVQIAKSFGAEVTGVCSTQNLQMVRSIGADHVIDYTREDYTQGTQRYDLIFDTVGSHSLLDERHVLTTQGTIVIVGATSSDPWIGSLASFLKVYVVAPFVSQRIVKVLANVNKTDDLNTLRDLMQSGKVTPVIDRQYSLNETPAAIRYLETGHARGKLVINLD
jgi:NADPH:quinone reductase-like Zn-dependent oxidoreductase